MYKKGHLRIVLAGTLRAVTVQGLLEMPIAGEPDNLTSRVQHRKHFNVLTMGK